VIPRRVRSAILAIAAFAAASLGVRAQAPPGSEIVNVATCAYSTSEGAPGGPTVVPSNPARTPVVRADCFQDIHPVLATEPSGSVAPGDVVTWTVVIGDPTPVDLVDVRVTLRFDEGVGDPQDLAMELVPPPPVAVPIGASTWDPGTRTVEWRLDALPAGTVARFVARVPVSDAIVEETRVGAAATLTADGCADDPIIDPTDVAVVPPLLRLAKRSDRSTVVPGDAVVYTLAVEHGALGDGLDDVAVADVLPPGFRYLPGSTRVDGVGAPDPAIEADGRTLRFDLGHFEPGEVRTLRYAAVVTPAARLGEAVNRAFAGGTTPGASEIRSAPATASVAVFAGPFAVEGVLAGRVFVDGDGDGLAGAQEPGVPGVLVFLEDGRGAVTDIHGRWHVEGVRPGVHAVRIDPDTLPVGLAAADASAEAPGVAGSRFVELRASTLAVVDLPVGPGDVETCTVSADERTLRLPRPSLVAGDASPLGSAGAHLDAAARALSGPVAPRAAEVRCEGAAGSADARLSALLRDRLSGLAPGRARVEVDRNPGTTAPEARADDPPEDTRLAEAVRTTPLRVAILSPSAGDRAAGASTSVEVVFPSDHAPELTVNGRSVPADRIGARATLPSRGLTAARYLGIPLDPGRNVLAFRAIPPDGGAGLVADAAPWIAVPDEAAELRLEVPGERWTADGVTPGVLRIVEVDGSGVRTAARSTVTLEVDGAVASTPDLDPLEPGFQVRLQDGEAIVRFAPPSTPGRVRVVGRTRDLETDLEFPIAPGATRWRVLGLAEARAAGDGGVEGDGGAGPDLGDPIADDGARVAAYARGPLGRNLQVTARVDTARERDRDHRADAVDPDRFWPVYGDDAVAVEEAASQGKWYARVDGRRGFARWGDFASGFDDTALTRYDRRLSGLSGRVDGRRVSFEGFASESDQGAVRDVFEPDGTSGPYVLRTRPIVARSESVLVEVRERFRTETVVSRRILVRDLDYDLDPESGTLLLRAPLAPFDGNLDPVRLVVVYEARSGLDRVTAGGRVGFRVDSRFEAGATAIREEREGADLDMAGLDLRWQPVPGTKVTAEVAGTDVGEGAETAVRIAVDSRTRPNLTWQLAWLDLPAGFANPTYLTGPEAGGRRASGRVLWEATPELRVRGEATHQVDDRVDLERTTATVDVERSLGDVTLLGGLTHARSDGASVGAGDSTLARAGLRGRWGPRWTMELLREQPIDGGDAVGYPGRTRAGIAFRVREGLRAFALQEWEDGSDAARDRTTVGIEGRVTERTRASHRWFVDPSGDGRSIRSATAVETDVQVRDGHRLSLGASRTWTASGDDARDGTVLGAGYEIRGGRSLMTGRYEWRMGDLEDRHLLTAAGSMRFGRDWTLLVRERWFATRPDGAGTAGANRIESRIGLAWRPPGRAWQTLVRLEHEGGSGATASAGGVLPGVPTEPGDRVVDLADAPAGIGTTRDRVAPVFDRGTWALSVAAGARLTARQRLAVTWIGRHVDADAEAGIPTTFTRAASLHWSARVHERWTVGASLRHFDQDASDLASFGYGAQVGFRAVEDLWVVTGWNAWGTRDGLDGARDVTEDGGFVSVRFRFDEMTLSDLFR